MAPPVKVMRRGEAETLGGPYTTNVTEPQIWVLPADAAGDQAFVWQVVPSGTAFTTLTVTLKCALDGVNFVLFDTSTAVAGEARFPNGVPEWLQIVVSNVTGGDGTSKFSVLAKVR